MKLSILLELISATVVVATSEIPPWHPPRDGEVRSPCPGINVLANHGILPRSGRNMDKDMIFNALSKWYNIDEEISGGLFFRALNETGRPDATTFDMTDIRLHRNATVEAIEQDASFSRADYYWGDDYSLNFTVWDQTRSFWQGETIDVQEFGNAARARYLTSKATNPTFYYPDVGNIATAMSFMTNVLGDAETGTVPTAFVDDWIVMERLPTKFGWKTSNKATNGATIKTLSIKMFAASGLGEAGDQTLKAGKFVHAGVEL